MAIAEADAWDVDTLNLLIHHHYETKTVQPRLCNQDYEIKN
jgi:hypothetical protein